MTTPATLGFVSPTGDDWAKEGDNAITTNALASAVMYDTLAGKADAAKFPRPAPSGSQDLRALTTPGLYPLIADITDWQGQNYPINAKGDLFVLPMASNGSSANLVFVVNSTTTPRLFICSKASNIWGAWREVGEVPAVLVNKSTDLNGLPAPSRNVEYYVTTGLATDWQAQHYPDNTYGHITRLRLTAAWFIEVFREFAPRQRCFTRHVVGTAYQPWVNHDEDLTRFKEGVGFGSIRHDMLVDDLLAYHGGPIGTGGAAPVALTFDDYPRDFRDHMRDELKARGIPYTLALCSGMYDPAAIGGGGTWETVYDGAVGTTWEEIVGWLDADGAEASNHSRRHSGGSGKEYLYAETAGGLSELEAALGRKIWTWTQPSATYIDGDGNPVTFNNGDSIDAYAETLAGKYIWDHHAMITGVRLVNGKNRAPRRGHPAQGMTRSWISSTPGLDGTKASIQASYTDQHGIIVGSHANDIPDGRITAAQFTDFLDFLVVERDAGRIKLVTLSEWAICDTSLPA